ncbi:MAG: hypothetical protein RBU37_28410 [Myxococcota bacterium]|jgi:hypothetical protein|nr:hypothetical protein [Myxococcota bacterium]
MKPQHALLCLVFTLSCSGNAPKEEQPVLAKPAEAVAFQGVSVLFQAGESQMPDACLKGIPEGELDEWAACAYSGERVAHSVVIPLACYDHGAKRYLSVDEPACHPQQAELSGPNGAAKTTTFLPWLCEVAGYALPAMGAELPAELPFWSFFTTPERAQSFVSAKELSIDASQQALLEAAMASEVAKLPPGVDWKGELGQAFQLDVNGDKLPETFVELAVLRDDGEAGLAGFLLLRGDAPDKVVLLAGDWLKAQVVAGVDVDDDGVLELIVASWGMANETMSAYALEGDALVQLGTLRCGND